jgi:radical SAM superfamily enzyme YgiQ (UPF0313 family)
VDPEMKKTKVLLIDAQSHWLKTGANDSDQVVLPLGLMMIASHLKERFGDSVHVRVVNSNVDLEQNDEEAIHACLETTAPDIVGIRGLTRYRKEFNRIAKIAKRVSNALVVGGGPHVSSDEQYGMQDSEIDVAVVGEGEAVGQVPGAVMRQGTAGRANPARDPISDLDALPFADYDLVDEARYTEYLTYGYNKRRQGVLYTSRGCPFHCTFCHDVFGKRYRWRSPENIHEEVQRLYSRGIRDFYVVDDIFNIDKKRAMRFFELMSTDRTLKGSKFYFVNGLRGDLVDREFIDAAVEAGTIWLAYAIETASPRLQKVIRKNLRLDRIRDTIEYSWSKGVVVNYWGLLGIESETLEEAHQTIDLMEDLPPSVIPMLFSLKAYPGTEAYKTSRAKGAQTDLDTNYHSFLGLIRKDKRYLEVLDRWNEMVRNQARMEQVTQVLLNNGYTDEDISTSIRSFRLSSLEAHSIAALESTSEAAPAHYRLSPE